MTTANCSGIFCCYCCCSFLNNFHLLRAAERFLTLELKGEYFYQIFCKFTHKVFFDFSFFYIFSEKEIHPSRVCLSNDEKKRNFSSSSQCSRNITAKSKRSISHKRKYGGILWENTTIKMALRFTTTARTEFNFW